MTPMKKDLHQQKKNQPIRIRVIKNKQLLTRLKNCQGFTLAEVLIATFIFGIIALLTFKALEGWVSHESKLKNQFASFSQLQRTYAQLAEDILHTMERPIRDSLGDKAPSLTLGLGNSLLELSTYTHRALEGQGVRVSYRIQGDVLYRDVWPYQDRALASQPISMKLLEHVNQLELFALDDNLQEQQAWPPVESSNDEKNLFLLPKAIKIRLTHLNRPYEFLFLTPNS